MSRHQRRALLVGIFCVNRALVANRDGVRIASGLAGDAGLATPPDVISKCIARELTCA